MTTADVEQPQRTALDEIDVPEKEIENWQVTVDLLAESAGVPAALIMRAHERELEVLVASHSPGNVFHRGDTSRLDLGPYCATVMTTRRKLLVPNALKDPDWARNPEVELGMISYCGLPLMWPNGEIFGTICILDTKENAYDPRTHELIERFSDSIQFRLESLYKASAERHSATESLRLQAEEILDLYNHAPCGYHSLDADGVVVRMNDTELGWLGYSREEMIGKILYADLFTPASRSILETEFQRLKSSGEVRDLELEVTRKDGSSFFILVGATAITDEAGNYRMSRTAVYDITARKRQEAERMKLLEQLQVSQKMEAIGALAAGVAHDFNNLLSVILSYTGLALDALPEGDPVKEGLVEVKRAGERAAALTRQLLAFSRKQVLKPHLLDLSEIIDGVRKMLGRLVGENIELRYELAPKLGLTLADPGQMEQVLLNLVVNARDAMPEGGKLTIETSNLEIDEEYAARHQAVTPGAYVQLAVTDTGCGMDEETQRRMFEPFFTTKEKGKGTGLGLSTVHGIVHQSGGVIRVHSELGRGTTFTICLPRASSVTETPTATSPPAPLGPVTGDASVTILVAEDDESLRALAKRTLEAVGYTVLTARDGDEVLRTCAEHPGDIQLLVADVVMPGISCKKLADEVSKTRPTLEILYMSGHADDALLHHGMLEPGTNFLAKPFTAPELTRKVAEALAGGITHVADGHERAVQPRPGG